MGYRQLGRIGMSTCRSWTRISENDNIKTDETMLKSRTNPASFVSGSFLSEKTIKKSWPSIKSHTGKCCASIPCRFTFLSFSCFLKPVKLFSYSLFKAFSFLFYRCQPCSPKCRRLWAFPRPLFRLVLPSRRFRLLRLSRSLLLPVPPHRRFPHHLPLLLFSLRIRILRIRMFRPWQSLFVPGIPTPICQWYPLTMLGTPTPSSGLFVFLFT